jgi:TrmH family RNA methyltransferase
VDQRTLESLAQTKTPQGVVAVVPFLDHSTGDLAQLVPAAGPALVLVLHDLADPGNAGTLVRSAEAFGAAAVCFGPHAVEPYNDKVVRASMGSLLRVPILRYDEWPHFRAAAAQAQLELVAADAAGEDVRTVTLPRRAALLVGQERRGVRDVPAHDLHATIGLPQKAAVDSINAAVAGSILLYEFARAHGSKT